MTEKKLKIVNSALHLFAQYGVDGTSTAKVARDAGVSEGLIFRHFKNKEGLLNAILKQGAERIADLYQEVDTIEDPKEKLRTLISIPFSVAKKDYPFWRLLYALKWQAEVYDNSMMRPVKVQMTGCFKALGYAEPALEADHLLMLQDGVATTLILKKPRNKNKILQHILDKYGL